MMNTPPFVLDADEQEQAVVLMRVGEALFFRCLKLFPEHVDFAVVHCGW